MSNPVREANLLTTAEVAEELGVSVTTMNRWAAAGRIKPTMKAPGRTGVRLYHPGDVLELLDEQEDQ